MTHKNRKRGYNPTLAGSLKKDKGHAGRILGETLEPDVGPDGLEPDDCINHTHPREDVTPRTVDVDGHERVTSRREIELLNKLRSGGIVYLTDKPDEVLLAELDDLERLNAYDFFPEDYWGED